MNDRIEMKLTQEHLDEVVQTFSQIGNGSEG